MVLVIVASRKLVIVHESTTSVMGVVRVVCQHTFLNSEYRIVWWFNACRESESKVQEKQMNMDHLHETWHKQLLNSVRMAGVFCTYLDCVFFESCAPIQSLSIPVLASSAGVKQPRVAVKLTALCDPSILVS